MAEKLKVRMKTIYAGPEGTCQPGKTIDLEKEEAQSLVKAGYAEHAPAEKKTKPEIRETAVIEPPENTSQVSSIRKNQEVSHNRKG